MLAGYCYIFTKHKSSHSEKEKISIIPKLPNSNFHYLSRQHGQWAVIPLSLAIEMQLPGQQITMMHTSYHVHEMQICAVMSMRSLIPLLYAPSRHGGPLIPDFQPIVIHSFASKSTFNFVSKEFAQFT